MVDTNIRNILAFFALDISLNLPSRIVNNALNFVQDYLCAIMDDRMIFILYLQIFVVTKSLTFLRHIMRN